MFMFSCQFTILTLSPLRPLLKIFQTQNEKNKKFGSVYADKSKTVLLKMSFLGF